MSALLFGLDVSLGCLAAKFSFLIPLAAVDWVASSIADTRRWNVESICQNRDS